MSKTGEQTVRVLDEAYKTIRSGAPGLSDQTCNVLAGIIARKVSIVYAQPQPSQQAGAEGEANLKAGVEALQDLLTLTKINCDGSAEGVAFAGGVIEAYETFRLAALKPVEG